MDSSIKGRTEGLNWKANFKEILSDQYYQKEIDQIFKKSWLPIGHDTQIPNPGDFFTKEIPGLNLSMLVVRGKDKKVRVFHNLCRHRGFQVECAEKGNKRAFTCEFHGWVYDSQGKLKGVTDEDNFDNLDKDCHSLKEINAEVWETFIFINLDENPKETLREALGELADAYTGFFDRFGASPLVRSEVDCNWNLGINAFTENYHTLYLHAGTVPDYQGSPVNPLRHLPAMEILQRHGRYSTPNNPFHEQRESEKIAYSKIPPSIPTFISDTTGLPPGLNYDKVEGWAFDVIELFPNFVFLTGRDWAVEIWFWPISPDKSIFEIGLLLDPATSHSQRIAQEFAHTLVREVGAEDLSTLEKQHKMLKTGIVDEFPLSDQEFMLAHHYRVSREMIEG